MTKNDLTEYLTQYSIYHVNNMQAVIYKTEVFELPL